MLGADLPLIADDVTVEHLLAHRSGIGDYIDEDLPEEVPLKVPVQSLVTTSDYLPALDGFPTKFPAGARFSYCNGGFVVLALIAERVSGQPFHDLLAERVFTKAGMPDTAFLRSDSCPAERHSAISTTGARTCSTSPCAGTATAVPTPRPRTSARSGRRCSRAGSSARTGRSGCWPCAARCPTGRRATGWASGCYDTGSVVFLEGCDHGVSFRSLHDPDREVTATVIANTTDGAWPVGRQLVSLIRSGSLC